MTSHCFIPENRRNFSRGEGWGWREFISREELLDPVNNLIGDHDTLTIYCEVFIYF